MWFPGRTGSVQPKLYSFSQLFGDPSYETSWISGPPPRYSTASVINSRFLDQTVLVLNGGCVEATICTIGFITVEYSVMGIYNLRYRGVILVSSFCPRKIFDCLERTQRRFRVPSGKSLSDLNMDHAWSASCDNQKMIRT